MARTRTSDHTFRPGHAKRLVYACCWALTLASGPGAGGWGMRLGLGLGFGLADAAVEAQSLPQDVGRVPGPQPSASPCVECQILSVRPDQVGALPADLKGLTIAARISPGADPTAAVTALAARHARVAVHLVGLPVEDDPAIAADAALLVIEPPATGDTERAAFALKRALASARGRHPAMRLLVAAAPALASGLRARGLAPYADDFVAPPSPVTSVEELLAPIPSDATLLRVLPDEASAAAAVAAGAAALTDWFPRGLVAVPDRPLHCGEGGPIHAYLNPQTLDLLGTSRACPAPAPVTGDITGVVAERRDVAGLSAFRLQAGGGGRFAEGVTVGAAPALTAAEIVARHQAFAARQASSIRTDVASGTLTLTFEAPGFVAPVTVTSKTTIFRDAERVELRQADIRVNGVAFSARNGVPHLPIIEPERVAALPLTITLTSVYRYTLDGRDSVDGHPCYVIAFAPQQSGSSLFRGRAWIDVRTFAMVRVSAAQTGLRGPIVASEQTDTYAPDAGGRWLLARSDIRQRYEGASVRTPIQRLLVVDRHDVNASDFAARRAAAYASSDVMLRDTPEGFRYLERDTGRTADAGSRDPEPGGRKLAPPVTRIRTLATGVIVDPNITTPLPFAGLSYVDFDLFHTGTQFNGFFGGSYAQLAFSVPALGGTRWQMAGRAFGIATSYNDRDFENGKEIYSRDIRQQPAQASVWVLRPIAARAAVRFEYDWDYNRYRRADVTDPAFVIPRNQNAHGVRAGLDLQHAGWQASLWAGHTVRVGWQRWGIPGSPDAPVQPSFDEAGVSVLQTRALSPRVTTRIEGSFTTGRNLDRFSRISFGTFDNRLHGYPSALIRYDRGAVLRTAISWAAAAAVRVDGFADTAAVHDPAFGRGLRNYTGFGAAFECPAPFGMLFAAEWGYGVQGVNTDGRLGTQVVRITAYKVF